MKHFPSELMKLLEQTESSLLNNDEPLETISLFINELHSIRSQLPQNEWKEVIQEYCQKHSLKELFLQDPFTRRAYEKPRSYAGDAIMLDYIYAADGSMKSPSLENETEFGRRIHPYMMEMPAGRAVRSRRKAIAERLEQIAQTTVHPHVLAVACGHLREVEISSAVKQGQLGRYIALDNDPDSLNMVENHYNSYGVETYHASVFDILKGKVNLSGFDLIYSLGLYDYLEERVAQKLTERLFSLLKPGGTLYIANFHSNDETSAYIEAFCDWWLIYRDESEMENLLGFVPTKEIQSTKKFFYENSSIIYLEVQKV